MPGCVYGGGVGPGDPELMTLKAVRILKAADVIACPGKPPEESTAYKIAVRAVPEIVGKERLSLSVPMTKDQSVLEKEHIETARRIEQLLDAGKDVACLTLGDPTIYSSFCYYQKILKRMDTGQKSSAGSHPSVQSLQNWIFLLLSGRSRCISFRRLSKKN